MKGQKGIFPVSLFKIVSRKRIFVAVGQFSGLMQQIVDGDRPVSRFPVHRKRTGTCRGRSAGQVWTRFGRILWEKPGRPGKWGAIFIKFGRAPAIKKTFIVCCSLDKSIKRKSSNHPLCSAYITASRPLRSIRCSNLSEGPLGCISPDSHFRTVERLMFSNTAKVAWLILLISRMKRIFCGS